MIAQRIRNETNSNITEDLMPNIAELMLPFPNLSSFQKVYEAGDVFGDFSRENIAVKLETFSQCAQSHTSSALAISN